MIGWEIVSVWMEKLTFFLSFLPNWIANHS